jgi:hypothetical protein
MVSQSIVPVVVPEVVLEVVPSALLAAEVAVVKELLLPPHPDKKTIDSIKDDSKLASTLPFFIQHPPLLSVDRVVIAN